MIDFGAELPTLEGERINLRWLRQRDVPQLYSIFSDQDVMRYWSSTPMESVDEAQALLEEVHDHFRKHTLYQWGVALRSDDRVIGTCTLVRFDLENKRTEIGYALHRGECGNGYASEALRLLLTWTFDDFGMHKIEADVDPRNVGSINLLERFGFVREGLLRERYQIGGEIQDSLMFGLIKREFVRQA